MKYITLFAASLASASLSFGNQVSESQQQYIAQYQKQPKKVAPESALINTNKEPSLNEGFVSLYNGKDLDGWTPRGGTCTFEASGEAIIGTCVNGSPSTYLSTDREDYGDFIFTAELKWEVDGNSGVMFRAKRKPGKNFETVYGPQCEMEGFEKDRGWSGGIYGQSAEGWRYPLWLDAHKDARKALKENEWNRVTIKAVGTNVKTWVNGVPAANWESDEYLEGFFSLQIHAGKQGKVHFRNIKVKELSAQSEYEDLFADGDFSKWQDTKGGPVKPGWEIKGDIIERTELASGQSRPGDINTKKHYKDFDLKFDWKISEGGNSGVKYRTRGSLGLEYQVLDDGVHKDKNLSAGIYALVPAAVDKPYNAGGQWNSGRIIVQDNLTQHWINGVKVAEVEIGSEDWFERFNNSKYSKHEGFGTWTGPILLQDHNDPVSFRNVLIREL
ncbi:MAG: 3-keto-disaccharide hydrolase [Opitutaceae bacterium]